MLAFGFLYSIVIACIVLSGTPTQANAYVDPSVMTNTIQAVAGVAVALSAVAGVMFRRTRKAIFKLFNIEPKHTADSAVRRIDPSHIAEADTVWKILWETETKTRQGLPFASYAPYWKKRVPAALVVALLFMFTLMIVAPYELIAGNESSLAFGLPQLWGIFILPAIIVVLLLTIVVSVFRGRGFNLALMLLFGLSLATYVQVAFMNGALPSSDGSVVDWTHYKIVTCAILIVWIAIVVGPFALRALDLSRARIVVMALSVFYSSTGSGCRKSIPSFDRSNSSRNADAEISKSDQLFITEKGLLTVSPRKNIVIFVLNMYDENIDLAPCVAAHPKLLDEMTGFTWFQNITGTITPICDAVPTKLTGHEIAHEKNYSVFCPLP